MFRPNSVRLRTLTLILVGVALIPATYAILYFWFTAQQDERVRAKEEIKAIANLVVHDQEQWLNGANSMLSTIASGPSVRRTDMRQICSEFLTNLKQSSPHYLSIKFVDLAGVIQCRSNDALKSVTIASSADWPGSAHASAEFPHQKNNLLHQIDSIEFRREVRNDANVIVGTAFVNLDLSFVRNQLDLFSMSRKARIIVVTASGQLLAASKHAAEELSPFVTIRPASTEPTVNPELGSDWLLATQTVGRNTQNPWYVFVGIPLQETLTPLRTRFASQLATVSIATITGFLLALFFARFFLEQPILQFIRHMRVAFSSLQVQSLSLPSIAEFAELQIAFSALIKELQIKQRELKTAQQIAKVGFFELDLAAGVSRAPAETYEILGLDPSQGPVPLEQYQALIHPDDDAAVRIRRTEAISGGRPFHMQHRVIRPDGEVRWLNSYGLINRDENGTATTYYGAIQDITEIKEAENLALVTERRFRLLFENSLDGVLQVAENELILSINPAACKILDTEKEQIIGASIKTIFDSSDKRIDMFLSERATTGHAIGSFTLVRGDGTTFEAEASSSLYLDTDGTYCASFVIRDITQRIAQEKSIQQLAYFDALTGLPNRRSLINCIQTYLESAGQKNKFCALMFLDLDNFKNINDSSGHLTGDALLKLVAHRLKALMRADDIVARIGGDEFVMVIPNLAEHKKVAVVYATELAERISAALEQPFEIDGNRYNSGASIGVTLYAGNDQTIDDLLREADTAMYKAKRMGRNCIVFFENAMQTEV